jgi:glycosyltransferase involved in cell wall biosynthesis
MRRVLFLSYNFPPLGGAGVQRPLNFVRCLPALSYEPVVVTGPGNLRGHWTPADTTLGARIPAGTAIYRTLGPEPGPSGVWSSRLHRLLRLQSPWARWLVEGQLSLGREVGTSVDLIYTKMQPYESAEAGARLSAELDKPWVADLGDPWALDEMYWYPTGVHRRIELRRMRRLLGAAAAVVMSTREAARRLRRAFPEFERKLVVTIPNGFDAGDFVGPPPPRDPTVFKIVHTGYLHTELGHSFRRTATLRRALGGGTLPGVDILPRSHVYLLEAIDRLLEAHPSLRARVELHLAGALTGADLEVAEKSPVVRIHGYLSHAETVALVRGAHLLFLPMHDLPAEARASIVPGKTYEYVASGTPILAAVPDGDARDLLTEAGNAFLCDPTDVAGMAQAILARIKAVESGEAVAPPRSAVVERYEYRRLTADLASVFDAVIGDDNMARALLQTASGPEETA